MKIIWFVSGVYEKQGRITSDLASVRLRCLEPSYSMKQVGHDTDVRIIALNSNVNLTEKDFEGCDVVIFGKVFSDLAPLYKFINKLNIPIVADVCDDILSLEHLAKPYESLSHYCSAFIVSTEGLGRRLAERYSDKEIYLIADMVEGDKRSPKAVDLTSSMLKVGWFGQGNNLSMIEGWLKELSSEKVSFSLDVVTRVDDYSQQWLKDIQQAFKGIEINLISWSLEAQDKMLEEVDLVIIPSKQEQTKVVKTANRLVTAIWAGVPVVAYPLPEYQDFSSVIPVTDSVVEGIRWWQEQKEVTSALSEAQELVETLYGKKLLADEWFDSLKLCASLKESLKARDAEMVSSPSSTPIRLNLGCGDKILPGFINVDLVDERAGNKPDVQCDIRNLTVFQDNYADEVMTVHVIEHFYYWEAAKVLREWVRVLKPGGKMIIECPNLLTACQEVLNNPEQATGPGPEGQRTMWVLYGDPQWQDPLMCHKWLYTPQSLAKLMSECGLTDIRQEPAQFKLREPRDMRLVGIKTV